MTTLIDPRYRQLSYSSLKTLHTCPRKFQLSRLEKAGDPNVDIVDSITKAFGTVVGMAIQEVFSGTSRDKIVWLMYTTWLEKGLDPEEQSPKHKKSLSLAIHALDLFIAQREAGFLQDWNLLYYEGKPAIELSLLVNCRNDFKHRGFIDIVVQHKHTGQIMVVEVKTDSSKYVSPIKYKDSTQALSYSVLLGHILPKLTSYTVTYIIYLTELFRYEIFPFTKSILMKAEWLNLLDSDIDYITMLAERNNFPKLRDSCISFGTKQCAFYGTCNLSDKYLVQPLTSEIESRIVEDNSKYQIQIDYKDIVESLLISLEEK